MLLTEQTDVSIETLQEAVDGGLEVLEVLVHQSKVEVQSSDIWVVLSC